MKKYQLRLIPILTLLGVFAVLLPSCQKEEISKETKEEPYEFKQISDSEVILFSKILAKAQKRPEVRSFLDHYFKLNQFEHQVVFLNQVKNKIVTGNETFISILKEELANLGVTSRTDFFAQIINDYPTLSFTIYTGSDEIPIADFAYNEAIYVLPETENFRQLEERFELGYDGNTNSKEFSNNEDPEIPVIVIENSPSYVMFRKDDMSLFGGIDPVQAIGGNLCAELYASVQNAQNNLWTFIVNGGTNDDEEFEVITTTITEIYEIYEQECLNDVPDCNDGYINEITCERDTRCEDEVVRSIKVDKHELKTFCKWWHTHCKIEVLLGFIVNPDALAIEVNPIKFINEKRKFLKKDKWYDSDLPMYKWRYLEGIHGDAYTIHFKGIHPNEGDESTFTVGFKPTIKFKYMGAEITYSNTNTTYEWSSTVKNTDLGGAIVDYCDIANGDGQLYTTGSVDFYMKEAEE